MPQIEIPKKLFDELAEIVKNPESYKEDIVLNAQDFDEDISEYAYCICENCGVKTKLKELIYKYNCICPECNTYIKHLIIR